jgi:DNA/RNA endonuclease YhcR with UshA esterase domain
LRVESWILNPLLANRGFGGYHQAMKNLTVLIPLLFALCASVRAEEAKPDSPPTIKASEAKEYIGTNVVATGKIAEVNKVERLVRLNFDKPFPKQPLTAVIFSTKTNLFPDLDTFKGKKVEVSGKITDYHGRPQIVLDTTNQLKVVEQTRDTDKK